MVISEAQLDTWSKQGSITQSKTTYATVRAALEDSPPYANRSYSIFLQGSYGNDTNIYADSDVDVVIATDSMYYEDTSELDPASKQLYEAASVSGQYSYADFKGDVVSQLVKKFGLSVEVGSKAIFVEGNGSRRDTDVLAAAEFRRWFSYSVQNTRDYASGIVFWRKDGVRIVNYPKQHSANCTSKHQATSGWFKPSVRILKNMRNAMVAANFIREGLAPSYFLEGMLYNVPAAKFGGSFQQTMVEVLTWLQECDRSALICANGMYKLLHPTSPVTWRAENFEAYLSAAIRFWNDK